MNKSLIKKPPGEDGSGDEDDAAQV